MNKCTIKTILVVTVVSLIVGITGGMVLAKESWFSDVGTAHWGYDAIKWARDAGIVEGYKDGTYKPNQNVNEAEFLSMLLKTYKCDVEPNEGESWTQPLYDICAEMNYPTLGQDDIAARKSIIDRTKVAEIIAGTQGYNYSGVDAIKYLLDAGLSEGKEAATIEGYHGEDGLTRAEAVQFIKNILDVGISEDLLVRPEEPSNKDTMAMNFFNFDMKEYMTRLFTSFDENGINHRYGGWVSALENGNENMYYVSDFLTSSKYPTHNDYNTFDWDNGIQYRMGIDYYDKVLDSYVEGVEVYYDNTGLNSNAVSLHINSGALKYDDHFEVVKLAIEAMGMEVPDDYAEILFDSNEDILNWGGADFVYVGRYLWFPKNIEYYEHYHNYTK